MAASPRSAPLRLVPPAAEWLTHEQVAAELGMDRNTLTKLREKGLLTARPHGTRSYRYARAAVEAFKAGQATTPPSAGCPDCARLQERIERLGALLADWSRG